MKLTPKQVILLSLLVMTSLVMWCAFPQNSNKISYQSYRYLSEIRKSGPYIIKRLSATELDYVPCLSLGNKKDEDALYLDPKGESIWYLSVASVRSIEDHVFYDRSFWTEIDFEGNVLQVLGEKEMPAEGGYFVRDKLGPGSLCLDRPNGPLYLSYFKRNHFNWRVLNPLRIYEKDNFDFQPISYWDGIAYLTLNMQEGDVDFKTETSNTDYGYQLEAKLFEVPATSAKNQAVILSLNNGQSSRGDRGVYLIYKRKV